MCKLKALNIKCQKTGFDMLSCSITVQKQLSLYYSPYNILLKAGSYHAYAIRCKKLELNNNHLTLKMLQ